MKKMIFLLSVVMLAVTSMRADTYNYLNFVNSNNVITQVGTKGLRMTFSNGVANVTADGKTAAINLANMAYMEFSNTQVGGSTYAVGDVNGDGRVDIEDVNILINIILNRDDGSAYDGRQYVTGGTIVDITDVNLVINVVLGKN